MNNAIITPYNLKKYILSNIIDRQSTSNLGHQSPQIHQRYIQWLWVLWLWVLHYCLFSVQNGRTVVCSIMVAVVGSIVAIVCSIIALFTLLT